MAISDNTSYELTGAQVKDLASKVKDNTALAKNLAGGESRTSQLIYMVWIDIENAQRIADEISDTALTVQNNMVYRFFYAATGAEIKSPDDLSTLIDAGYVIEYLNQPGLSSGDNAQETMIITAAKSIVDDEDEEIYHAELQLKSISQATGNVISKNIVVDHAPSGASYWYKTTTTEGPAGRVACLVQDMFGSGEVNGITAEINASLPEGVDPLGPSQVWSIMELLFRDPKTGEFCKTISQIRALLRSGNSYKGQVVYIPHDDNNSAGMVITRYGWTGNASTGHGFVDILDLSTGELRTHNVVNISKAGFTDNRQYCWYYVYVDSAKMNYSCGFFEDNATVYDVTTDAPSLKFEVAYDANDNLYMASDNSSASDWKQINNDAIVPFTGATAQQAGTAGLVPAPTASDTNKYLKSDGTWATAGGGGGGGDQKIYVTMGSWNSDGDKCTLTLYSDEALTQTMTQSDFKAIANSSDDVTFIFVNNNTTPTSVVEVSYASYLQIWEPTQYSQYSLVRYWINCSLYTTSNYSQKPHIDWDSRNANAQLIFFAPVLYVPVVNSSGTGTFTLAGYSEYQSDTTPPDYTNRYAFGWYNNSTNKIYFELDTGLNFDGFPQTVELLDKNGYGRFNPQILCMDRSNSSIFTPATFYGIPGNCSVAVECDTTAGEYGSPTGTLKLKFTISPNTTVRFEGTVFILLKGIEIGINMNS